MTSRNIFYDTAATSKLKLKVLEYVGKDGLTIGPMPLRQITGLQEGLELEGAREGKSKALSEGFYDGHSYEIKQDNFLGENTDLWPLTREVGTSLAEKLYESDSVNVKSAKVMLDGVNRPLQFRVNVQGYETEFYYKPFMASRVLGNYLWNLLSGRTEHRFKASSTGILEEKAIGKHEWEIEDLIDSEYIEERFRTFILVTHVGIGDFAIKEDNGFVWKKSQYKVTDDKKVMPFDFDYLNLTPELYEEQLSDLLSLDGITRELFDELHADEDEGLKSRYALHKKRLKDLIKVIRPQVTAAYLESKKGKRNDEVIELFSFFNNLTRNLKEHAK